MTYKKKFQLSLFFSFFFCRTIFVIIFGLVKPIMAGVSGTGDVQPHRSHRSRQSGPSAKKKSKSDKRKRDISDEKKHNPKVHFSCFISAPFSRI